MLVLGRVSEIWLVMLFEDFLSVSQMETRLVSISHLSMVTPLKTKMAMEKHQIFNRRYIFKWLEISIVMLVFGGVIGPFDICW